MEEASTSPKPHPRGAPIFRNFSLGAHTATVDNPAKHEIPVYRNLFEVDDTMVI